MGELRMVVGRTVKRPRDMVPTNFERVTVVAAIFAGCYVIVQAVKECS